MVVCAEPQCNNEACEPAPALGRAVANTRLEIRFVELGIVVPCYNEEAVLRQTCTSLLAVLTDLVNKEKIASSSKIWLVDDGSRDGTWNIAKELATQSDRVCAVKLSRNRGHQRALLAGLLIAEGDALISMDADMQDDISCIEAMVDEWRAGTQIVYGVRDLRDRDTPFKRLTALGFYRLMRMMGVNVIYNHADYRLMTRRVLECLRQYPESNLFLRGIVPSIGFKSAVVKYNRQERLAGSSKYPFRKMLGFALNGITSFSVVPLRIIAIVGFVVFALSALMSVWVVAVRLFTDQAVPGWASTVLPIYLISGIQILALGIIGEYVGRIYTETKSRPRYFIEDVIPERRGVGNRQKANAPETTEIVRGDHRKA